MAGSGSVDLGGHPEETGGRSRVVLTLLSLGRAILGGSPRHPLGVRGRRLELRESAAGGALIGGVVWIGRAVGVAVAGATATRSPSSLRGCGRAKYENCGGLFFGGVGREADKRRGSGRGLIDHGEL